MKFIADLHIHSHFSIATSKQLIPEYLDLWARIKGISVIATGDFTHPGWLAELKEKLIPDGTSGLYLLKPELRLKSKIADDSVKPRFILSGEISNIYKKNGKVRKVHNLIFSPDFETVSLIQQKLSVRGFNISSDGRPILGLGSKELLEIALDCSQDIFFIPAHIWTPWFSVLGSKSGFDSIEECFEDMTPYIFAVETGLSTNPPMNWLCSQLDRFTLISNSDAHSPEKLGRNANIFNTELSYEAIINALKTSDPSQCLGTIDMFPQEGKYHFDGHRKCRICWNPVETLKHQGICPVCRKKVVIGVTNRVLQLSDRDNPELRTNRLPFHSIIPLKELLSEIEKKGVNSKFIQSQYELLIKKYKNEFSILLHIPHEELKSNGNYVLAEAIRRMRCSEIYAKEGYDGQFGTVKVFGNNEAAIFRNSNRLFKNETYQPPPKYPGYFNFDLKEFRLLVQGHYDNDTQTNIIYKASDNQKAVYNHGRLNKAQKAAAEHSGGPAIVFAGPGTGKTRVLTHRITYLIQEKKIPPGNILALTFSNKAAQEIRERIKNRINIKGVSEEIHIHTFHSFGLSILEQFIIQTGRSKNFSVIDDNDKEYILRKIISNKKEISSWKKRISELKREQSLPADAKDETLQVFKSYQGFLKKNNLFDFDDLIFEPLHLFQKHTDILHICRETYQWILVDEFQDIDPLQYAFIQYVTDGPEANIYIIGDPDQAIYGFRGADVRLSERFKTDFPAFRTYELSQSYRCTDKILQASSDVLNLNRKQIQIKGLQEGIKLSITSHPTDKSEAEYIARTIEQMIGGLRFFSIDSAITEGINDPDVDSLNDFAVLVRSAPQMSLFEKAFRDHAIPYQIAGDKSLRENNIIRVIIDILKISTEDKNDFLRNKLLFMTSLTSGILTKIITNINGLSVKKAIEIILDTISPENKNDDISVELHQLSDLADNFGKDRNSFIRYVTIGAGIDIFNPKSEKVTLMTIHASKGLEFNCVFLAGCEDGIIPFSLFHKSKIDVEEEKRLMYVGMTRAKKYLFLSHAHKRHYKGRHLISGRSPFVDLIERELVEFSRPARKIAAKKDTQLKLFE